MIFISLWLVNQHLVYGDEKILFQITSGVKKIIFGMEKKPSIDDYIFVNISYDNMFIPKYDKGFKVGNQPITDRQKLAQFFERLNKRPDSYKYIVCDILFKDTSEYDSLLYSKMKDLKNIIIPYNMTDSGTADIPIFNINKGLAEYHSIQYVFMKYSLTMNDTLKSLPIRMYEDLTGKQLNRKGIFSSLGDKPSFNTLFVDFKLRYNELLDRNPETGYILVNLGQLMRIKNDSVFYEYLNGKIIFIGDLYEKDIHQTLFGNMSGTLILFNVYLMLLNNEYIISFGLILFLFIGYFAISFDLFSEIDLKERKYVAKISRSKLGKFIIKYLSFVIYLMIISVITYFLFNLHINILLLAVYLKLVDSLLKYVRDKRNKKHFISDKERNEI